MIFNKFTYIILSITIILAACKQTPKIDPIKDITETYGTGGGISKVPKNRWENRR
ncbi:MAG: hypothetical protein IPO48_09355 [Saprospiraceae bacterium]|nr:hypothetical protein [Saprospiraceae bacterium]